MLGELELASLAAKLATESEKLKATLKHNAEALACIALICRITIDEIEKLLKANEGNGQPPGHA